MPLYGYDQRHCRNVTFIFEISEHFACIGTGYICTCILASNIIVGPLSISPPPLPQLHFSYASLKVYYPYIHHYMNVINDTVTATLSYQRYKTNLPVKVLGTFVYIIKTIVALLSISPPPLPQLHFSYASLQGYCPYIHHYMNMINDTVTATLLY